MVPLAAAAAVAAEFVVDAASAAFDYAVHVAASEAAGIPIHPVPFPAAEPFAVVEPAVELVVVAFEAAAVAACAVVAVVDSAAADSIVVAADTVAEQRSKPKQDREILNQICYPLLKNLETYEESTAVACAATADLMDAAGRPGIGESVRTVLAAVVAASFYIRCSASFAAAASPASWPASAAAAVESFRAETRVAFLVEPVEQPSSSASLTFFSSLPQSFLAASVRAASAEASFPAALLSTLLLSTDPVHWLRFVAAAKRAGFGR